MTDPNGGPVATDGRFALPSDLQMFAEQLNDIEVPRIGMGNRYRRLIRPTDQLGKDDNEYGQGYSPDDAPAKLLAEVEADMHALEKRIVAACERGIRKGPWGPWLASAPGVGAKTLIRLLATIGDPRWNDQTKRPRTLAQLLSYSGMAVVDGVAPRRQKGILGNWNPETRVRLFNIAECCVRYTAGPSRFRDRYYDTKQSYEGAVHTAKCHRCGTKGSPAAEGAPLRPGHIDARGKRAISKMVLTELWLESRRLHGETVTVEPPPPGLRKAA